MDEDELKELKRTIWENLLTVLCDPDVNLSDEEEEDDSSDDKQ